MKYYIIFLLVFLSCKSQEETRNDEEITGIVELENSIDSIFNSKIEENGPGAAILVAYDNEKLISKGYGLRDLDKGQPITPSTNLRIGSVSKQFTVLTVLSLVDEGAVSLKDTVSKYLPSKTFSNITIEQLSHHTSGVADYEQHFEKIWDTTKIVTNQDVLNWYYTNPQPLFAPGTKWEYSNGGYNLLASLVEKVSGQKFAEYARENVFEKAGMVNTNFFNLADPIEIPERAYCYNKNENREWEKVDGHFLNGCLGEGAVYSSLNDFFEYDKALRKGNFLSAEAHDLVFETASIKIPVEEKYKYSFHQEPFDQYAKGWFVNGDIAYHSGSWIGQRSMVVRGLEEPFTIALFMNIGDGDLRKELIDETYLIVRKFLDQMGED